MRWGTPYSFLLLLGAVPLILLFHSLKPRGIKVSTTTLFLWERILKDRPIGKRVGWLVRRNLFLLLQILICLMLIVALADPFVFGRGFSLGDKIVVLDMSASMKARGPSGSRFDTAQKELLALIDTMGPNQRMMVIGAGPTPRVLIPFGSDKKRLKRLVRELEPSDAPVSVKQSILFAHSFLGKGGQDQVVVLSDGAFDGGEELPWGSGHLRLVRIDGGGENVAIIAFNIRRLSTTLSQYEMMVVIKNFASRPLTTPMTTSMGERVLARETLQLKANERRVLVYPYRGPLEAQATALLGYRDDFSTDNRAFATLSESPHTKLLYVGKGNLFLEHLFHSLPYVQVTRRARVSAEIFPEQTLEYDVILLDGVPVPPLKQGNFVLINTLGGGLPLELRGKLKTPRLLPITEGHPLLEGITLDGLFIKEANHVALTGKGISLVGSRESPLIFAFEKGRLKALVIGFDLLGSDLPFRVAFPLLMVNALEWMQPKRAEFPATQVQAGLPYTLESVGEEEEVEVKTPSGKTETLKIDSIPFTFGDTLEVGVYTFREKTKAVPSADRETPRLGHFSVNLFSESESEIRPRQFAARALDGNRGLSDTGETEAKFPLSSYFLIVAFLLLIAEGLFWFSQKRGSE
jgi:hypothetical protein